MTTNNTFSLMGTVCTVGSHLTIQQLAHCLQEQVSNRCRFLVLTTRPFVSSGRASVERDSGVGLQEADEVQGRLFQAEGDLSLRMLLAQFSQPDSKGFGGSFEDLFTALAGLWIDQTEIGLAIGTIQAGDQVIGIGCVHEEEVWGGAWCFGSPRT
jgi:hypothetical protein